MFKRLRDIFKQPQEQEAAAEDDEELLADEAALNEAELEDAADLDETAAEDEAAYAAEDAIAYAEEDATATEAEGAAIIIEEAEVLPDEAATEAYAEADEEAEFAEIAAAEDDAAAQPQEAGRFNPFRLGLQRTRGLFGRVNQAFNQDEITDDLWDELEETLLAADVGFALTEKLMKTLRDRVQYEKLTHGSELREALKEELQILLGEPEPLVFSDTSPISVFLVVGVNGVGKTTSIAKLANLLKRDNYKVILAAGDTFRAAATEQIKTWGERLKVPVVSHQHGADPAAVVFDAMESAQARKFDVLIVDTAGRLHTKSNLMEELKKIGKVLARYDPEAPHEVLLVLDATTGQNAIIQAKTFVEDSGVSGIILTKLDGTARGGVVFSISSELGLPIKFIGTGEKVNDIAPFDPTSFVDALFED
jgi:fused signal recognition particle receptor